MNHSITLDGKNYIMVPQEEYQALVDMADLAEAHATKARIDAGEETWPAEIVEAMVKGEHPVRVFRKYRRLKMVDLADEAEISQPYLSDIENHKRTGTVAVIKRLAAVLNVDMEDIA